jgi:inner membrane protein involved in colicin E2 resistance
MKKINWLKVAFIFCIVCWLALFIIEKVSGLNFHWSGYAGFALVYGALFSLIALLANQAPAKEN